MFSTLLFDMYGVFFLESDKLFNGVAHDFGMNNEELTNAIWAGGALEDHKIGRMNENDYWNCVYDALPDTFKGDKAQLPDKLDYAIELNTDLVQLVRGLKSKYRIAALSNASSRLERRIANYGISDLFEIVINSHRVCMAKPDECIYKLALQKLQVHPREILFVDDKLRNTVVAARMGFHTHVYRDIKSFSEMMSRDMVR